MEELTLRRPPEWRSLPGIYRVWSQDRTLLYVGSAACLDRRRANHNSAILLGGRMEVVELMPNSTRSERCAREDFYIKLYVEQGLNVVVRTNLEINRERNTHWPSERRLKLSQSIRNRTAEEKEATQEKRLHTTKVNGKAHSVEMHRQAYATRKAKGNALGSTRTRESYLKGHRTRRLKRESERVS